MWIVTQGKNMQTKKLADALGMVGRFIHPRSPLDKFRMVWIREVHGGTAVSTSTTTGAIEVFIDEPCGVAACVQHAIMAGVVRTVKQEEIDLAVIGSNLDIYTASGKLSIPDYEYAAPDVDIAGEFSLFVASAALRHCSRSLRPLADSSELRYANSQRLYVDENVLRVVCSNSRAWGCTWCESSASDFDVMVPNNSIQAAVECLPGEVVSLTTMPGGVSIVSDDVSMMLPLEMQGTPHRPYSSAAKAWEASQEWLVSRQALRDFLGQVGVFATVEATGFWMIPTVNGLLCRYTGRADGTHAADKSVNGYCESLIEGRVEGEPVYVSSSQISSAVESSGEDGFVIRATPRGVFILSEGFSWGVGCLAPPQEVGS